MQDVLQNDLNASDKVLANGPEKNQESGFDVFLTLQQHVNNCLASDRFNLRRRIASLQRRLDEGKPIERSLDHLLAAIRHSREQVEARRAQLPIPTFDDELPINQRRDEIAAAIQAHPVVVICGETGSGKTTQLPKICLSLGFGAAGLIGHTQPRRIAARSVAARIASELESELGHWVGYKVRFSDRLSPHTVIKVMTDGILLAETQSDRYLSQYDILIIDEAHERSLNIDFLIGYVHRLLSKRPDLKLIITSATIDPDRFARHFDGAPVLEVSGRTYPVEIRYRPLQAQNEDERDRDLQQALADAVDELCREGPGDILVFLTGEREIRETTESLRKRPLPHTEIVPLYARLSASEQNRIFQPHSGRRIVLATNVAETSLTVPGIRYVIDTGYARLSRYSPRSKIQRLPIEKISQASANQRAGRCGRLTAGICIRLYDIEDFQSRPLFTDPEILRTNLAAVILQMAALQLGPIQEFPFIDPPDSRQISDGFNLLFELQAVDAEQRITELGKQLAKLPIDPRLGRMILAAQQEGCLREVLIITSQLAIQDPRERPLDNPQPADAKHRRFHDERSDFIALLNLWNYYHEQARHLSKNKLRALCQEEFLSFVRMREWHDLHQELHMQVTAMNLRLNEQPADYMALHRALLTGLLSHIGVRQEEQMWLGARSRRFYIFPGSGLFKKPPRWLIAAEIVETTRLYARTIAKIEPQWIEPLALHLVRREYAEPYWDKRVAQVSANEKVTLYGLPIVTGRRINFGPLDPATARVIFIRHALVEQDWDCKAPFFIHNQALLAELEQLEEKTRQRIYAVDEETLFRFYDARIPEGIYNGPLFEKWRTQAERENPKLLFLDKNDLLDSDTERQTIWKCPDALIMDGREWPLSYRFAPGESDDGVTLTVPIAALNQLDVKKLEWLVPGLLEPRIAALLKSLPKAIRKHFVPVPEYAHMLMEALTPPPAISLTEAMAIHLHKVTGVMIPADAWRPQEIPEHLQLRLQVIGDDGEVLAVGRDLKALQDMLQEQARQSFAALPTPTWERSHLTDWDFEELPEQVTLYRQGIELIGYPTLRLESTERLSMDVVDTKLQADALLRASVRWLIQKRLRESLKNWQRTIPMLHMMTLQFASQGNAETLQHDLLTAILDRAFLAEGALPRTRAAFEACLTQGKAKMPVVTKSLCETVRMILAAYHDVRKLMQQIANELPLASQEILNDLNEQLDRLIYPGFISRTPALWLDHIPRYLKAIQVRLNKFKQAPDKDRLRRAQMAQLWEHGKTLLKRDPELADPDALQFRWLLEELRVSIFAQEVKTAYSVSIQRLENLWQKLLAR